MKKVIALLALFCMAACAQDTFTDSRDGKKYKTAKIGNQTWIAQNLDYHGEDGFLGLCYGDEPQKKIKKPENCTKYGRLYNWNEAMKACPKGWHLPSDKEWQTLVDFAGGTKAGRKLRVKAENGSDDYGFSALPGGFGVSGVSFYNVGSSGHWWSATEDDASIAYFQYIYYDDSGEGRSPSDKSLLYSVRCVKD